MTKIVMLVCAAAALIQIIKPLGWPGLKRRQDAWKLVVFGAAATVVATILLSFLEASV
ncbi:MAG: hypothetical protein AAF441_09330 [Pseudomonadota bacterium]